MSTVERLSPGDPNSFSRPGIDVKYLSYPTILNDILLIHLSQDEVKVNHMDLALSVNFQDKTLSGHVTLSVEKVKPEAKVLVFIISCYHSLHDKHDYHSFNFCRFWIPET